MLKVIEIVKPTEGKYIHSFDQLNAGRARASLNCMDVRLALNSNGSLQKMVVYLVFKQ